MRVSRIFINTYRRDFHLARVCVSSIRYWYPVIPIWLVKDMGAGDFDTETMERAFDVRVLDTGGKSFGWGFGKFEPLFQDSGEPFLFMDADTVMTGPLLDRLADIDADFIVDEEVQPRAKLLDLYFDPEAVGRMDPSYVYPGYTFNTGQWAATPGMLARKDFAGLVEWDPDPKPLRPDLFRQADQGLFNYLLHKKHSEGAIRLSRVPLMIWPEAHAADHVSLDAIRDRSPNEDRVIHWAGMKNTPHAELPRRDIIDFFKGEYYRRVGRAGQMRDGWTDSMDRILDLAGRVGKRLRRSVDGKPVL